MHDSELSSVAVDAPIYGLDLSPETFKKAQSTAQGAGFKLSDWRQAEAESLPSILFIELSQENFKKTLAELEHLKNKDQALTLVIYNRDLDTDQLSDVINHHGVFQIIESLNGLPNLFKKAIEEYADKSKYFFSLKKVKEQNKTLETLNQNLEQVVHERTLKEFTANQEMETSVKEIQSILTFIKTISRAENIEELMLDIRKEFRKFHGLLPPILLLKNERAELSLHYFQGMQMTSKRMRQFSPQLFSDILDESRIRVELSNILGRPFGPLSLSKLNFQSQELQGAEALIIFEHSFVEDRLDDYASFSKERFPIVNMALENILLKDGLQAIAGQWARTFNEMEDPIIIINRQFKMSLSNSHFHRDKDKTCYEAFAGQDRPCKDCPMIKTFESAEPHVADIHVQNKVFRVHSYPIHLDGQGQVSHAINQYVDVTQSIDLQSRVIQGEKMAAVGLLAGNIAHELNNPLTGIRSLADLLLEDFESGSNTFKDLSEVRDAAVRCQRIIKDLLDFSSVGSETSGGTTEINQLVEKTLPLLKVAMRTLNSDLEFCDERLEVECQPQLLQQVIFNLINNACQAMQDGDKLTVITRKQQDFAQILVRDTGPGIPEDIQDSIFDPFFTTKKEGKGTGLGLSMSKSVIERAGGQLYLNKDYEDGTEFVISLPLVKS